LIDAESLLNLTDRVGHGTFIVGNHKLMELARDKPFELCLTSNIINKTRQSYEAHHFGDLFKANHPLCICTDDKGLFGASLSDEYEHVQRAFNLDFKTMFDISKKSIEHIFDTSKKAGLHKEFDEFLNGSLREHFQ